MSTLYRLEDLLANPALLEPPPIVVPRLGWAGRLTLLAAPEKSGKSTLVGQAIAAKATGREFLGEETTQGTTLWIGADESLNDIVRRFDRYEAKDHIVICPEIPADDEALLADIEDSAADVVVIDTLAEFAAGIVQDYSAAAQWTPALNGLRSVLRATDAAGILLHHTVKNGKTYRDSTQIGAGVDAILEMTPAEEDPTVRVVRTRGRMTMADFRLRFTDPWYQLDGTELPLELRVYRVVQSNPGTGLKRVRDAVYGRSDEIDAVLADLCRRGAIEDRGNGRGHAYHVKLAE